MFRKGLLTTMVFLWGAGTLSAQTVNNLAIGSVAASYLNLASSARIEGLGEAYVALADNVDALGVNPAGLGRMTGPQLLLTHDSYVQGADIEQAMGSLDLGTGNLAVGLSYGNFGTVQEYATGGALINGGTFQPIVWRLDAGYGFSLGSDLFAGFSGKLFIDNLDSDQSTGLAADLGALWAPGGTGLSLGLSFLNIGGQAGESIPTELRGGGAYSLSFMEGANVPADKLTVSFDGLVQVNDVNASRASLGAEYLFRQIIALRVGQQLMDTTGLSGWSGFSAGVGVKLDQVQFDYAYATRGDLGNVNLFSLLAGL